jgi:hypothetical protein
MDSFTAIGFAANILSFIDYSTKVISTAIEIYESASGNTQDTQNSDNLLVNDDFEIIGVIDFDGVMAAPIEVVAQYPPLTGLEREPPGHVETRPFAIDRIKRTEPKLKEYKNLVEIAEARMGGSMNGEASIANMMLSNATSVFQGLLRFASHQKFVNDKWMEAYLRLLREQVRSGEFPAP